MSFHEPLIAIVLSEIVLLAIVVYMLLQLVVSKRVPQAILVYVRKIAYATSIKKITIYFSDFIFSHMSTITAGCVCFYDDQKVRSKKHFGSKSIESFTEPITFLKKVEKAQNITYYTVSSFRQERLLTKEGIQTVVCCPFHFSQNIRCTVLFFSKSKHLKQKYQMLLEVLYLQTVIRLRTVLLEKRTKSYMDDIGLIEEVFEQAVQYSPSGFLITLPSMQILYGNDMILKIFKQTKEGIVGKMFYNFFEKGQVKQLQTIIDLVKKGKEKVTTLQHFEYVDVDGKKLYFELFCYPIVDSAGKIISLIIVLRDRTQHYQLQKKLTETQRKSNEQLHEKVKIATKELVDSNKELRRLNKLKTEFVSTITHELRTPLTSIKGYLALLKEERLGKLSKSQMDSINIVKEEADRLSVLIQDVLDFSRLDSGKSTLNVTHAKIVDIAKGVRISLKPQLEKKGIICKIYNRSNNVVPIDTDKIKQVFINLLNNSIKFSGEETIITIKIEESKESVSFSVTDQGIGIPKDKLENIFESFYTYRPDASQEIQGTGLGLAIAKSIVDLHKGTIVVESKYNKGTTFTVTLPKNEDMERT